jgi:hypothetical protein
MPMSDNRPTRFTQTPRPPKLIDQVRQGIRLKHMSSRTEDSYVHYIRQFILFHNTTMIYTHVLNRGGLAVRSPLDEM